MMVFDVLLPKSTFLFIFHYCKDDTMHTTLHAVKKRKYRKGKKKRTINPALI